MHDKHRIHFVTGNRGKFKSAREYAKMAGLDPDVFVHTPLDIKEIQADSVMAVARDKARKAHDEIQAPVIVNDGAFHIPSLGGFPGVYSEYILRKVGNDGILKLMDGMTGDDRSAYFKGAVAYIDKQKREHLFHGKTHDGHIAHNIRPMDRNDAWNEIWRLFIPQSIDGNKALSQLSDEQMAAWMAQSAKVSALYQAIEKISASKVFNKKPATA